MTGREGQSVVIAGIEDPKVVWCSDFRANDVVLERSLSGCDVDQVVRFELVEFAEWGAVRGSVAGDCGVTWLPRQWRVRLVAWAVFECVGAHAFDDDLVDADRRNSDAGNRLSVVGRWRRRSVVDGRGVYREAAGVDDLGCGGRGGGFCVSGVCRRNDRFGFDPFRKNNLLKIELSGQLRR
jgi:hypothetical protein